jgi:hypothetical protein
MGNSLTASYRLIYFQPDPEDGERVSVGLLFNIKNEVELLYDRKFPKLKCLAPHLDAGLIAMYLDDMSAQLRGRPSDDLDIILRGYEPYLVTSEVRKSAWPLTDKDRVYLIRRFLSKEGYVDGEGKPAKIEKEKQTKAHIRKFVQSFIGDSEDNLKADAGSRWITGERLPEIKSVALALRKNDRTFLIDGVDLHVLDPDPALKRITKVAHTFWQYGRLQNEFRYGRFKRIGVVLNGTDNPSTVYRDTHDFALHQFEAEGDLAVDAGSEDDLREFSKALDG